MDVALHPHRLSKRKRFCSAPAEPRDSPFHAFSFVAVWRMPDAHRKKGSSYKVRTTYRGDRLVARHNRSSHGNRLTETSSTTTREAIERGFANGRSDCVS